MASSSSHKKDINWRGVDLNLLIAFSALMETQSVTKAANKLAIGQSAMSHNLSRLRQLLNDPLFERQGHHMIPTQKALELSVTVENILNLVTNELLQPSSFEPKCFNGTFKIGLTDYAELLFAPAIFDAIHDLAPNSHLSFFNVDRHNYQTVFNEQQLDVVIGSMTNMGKEISSQYLYTEDHVCLFDSKATGLQAPITLAQYSQHPHALVSPDGQLITQVDNQLKHHALERQVAVGSRNFLTIRHLLKGRDLLCVVSRLMAQLDLFHDDLTQCPAPVDIADFDIRLLWLHRNATHPRNEWLRQLVAKTVIEQAKKLKQK
ncbi:LysR family transcriptional regulator [Photobacterium leiognathi]|uniref:LysR family transcriptional regulator n=1 Tax=Photobacterium leiognathi TaxID=553611 RepID=UPI002982A579|nr:LysR family transcriptional regulator [Photobacterium leiognathi]